MTPPSAPVTLVLVLAHQWRGEYGWGIAVMVEWIGCLVGTRPAAPGIPRSRRLANWERFRSRSLPVASGHSNAEKYRRVAENQQ